MAENKSSYKKDSKRIDLAALFQEYKSYWWLFLASVIGCCALAYVYSGIKLPQYQVQANVLVSEEEGSSNMSKLLMGGLFGENSSVDDEQIIMSSHSVLLKTVKDLGLNRSYMVRNSFFDRYSAFNDAPVDFTCDPSISDTLGVGLIFVVKVNDKEKVSIEAKAKKKTIAKVKDASFPVELELPYGKFTFDKTEFLEKGVPFKETIAFTNYLVATEGLSQSVDVSIPNKKANFLSLGMVDSNTERAKTILNAIVKNYNEKGIEDKQLKGNKTTAFIEERLNMLGEELSDAEQGLEMYKKKHNIVDVNVEARYLMERKSSIETQLLAAETENEVLRLTRQFIANPENKYSLIPLAGLEKDGAQSSLAMSINSYNGLILNRMKMENNAKSNNASLKVLNDQLDAMRDNINISLDKAIGNSNVVLSDLREQSRKSMSKLGDIPTQQREYYDIKRQQGVKEQLYLFLLQQREQTAMSLANSMPRGIVIDEAYSFSEPVSMSRKKMLVVAFILGLLLPVAFLFVRKKLRNRFTSKAEVEELVSVPVLGEVCQSRRPGTLVVKGSSSIAELFRLIRSNLSFVMSGSKDKVILVTSTMSGEGKSFVSVNLAASFALLGKKVILVGMDIRKPQLSQYLNIPAEPGLTQYLSGSNLSLSDIIRKNVGVDSLSVIVAGPVPPNPAELLSSDRVDELFEQLRKEYDYIIVDSAPVGMVSDTFVLDRVADASVYICRANYTSLNDLDFMNKIYEDNRLKKMSVIVNGTPVKKGYGYGYGKIDD